MLAGMPLMSLKRTKVLRIILCLTLLPVTIFLGFGVVSELFVDRERDLVAAAICGVLTVALGALFLWLFRRESGRETRLYEDGIAQTIGGKTREIRWSDVREVWVHAVRIHAGGLLGVAISAAVDAGRKGPAKRLSELSDNITVRIVGASERLKLSSNYCGVVAAFEETLRRVNPRLVADNERQYPRRPPGSLRQSHLVARRHPIRPRRANPYRDIEKLSIDGGRLSVKKRGAWLSKGGVAIQLIPTSWRWSRPSSACRGCAVTTKADVGRNLATRQSL